MYKDLVADPGNGIQPTSSTWAKKHIFGWSDEEIRLDLQQQRMERAIGFELTNTQNVIKRSGVFDDVDGKYGVPESERQEGGEEPGGDGLGMGGEMSTPETPVTPETGAEGINESNNSKKRKILEPTKEKDLSFSTYSNFYNV